MHNPISLIKILLYLPCAAYDRWWLECQCFCDAYFRSDAFTYHSLFKKNVNNIYSKYK